MNLKVNVVLFYNLYLFTEKPRLLIANYAALEYE